MINMIHKKSWEDFRSTGLLLFVNSFLHIFGWAIVLEITKDTIVGVYPARVKFRGFDEKSVSKAYVDVTNYIKQNITELQNETLDDDKPDRGSQKHETF